MPCLTSSWTKIGLFLTSSFIKMEVSMYLFTWYIFSTTWPLNYRSTIRSRISPESIPRRGTPSVCPRVFSFPTARPRKSLTRGISSTDISVPYVCSHKRHFAHSYTARGISRSRPFYSHSLSLSLSLSLSFSPSFSSECKLLHDQLTQ